MARIWNFIPYCGKNDGRKKGKDLKYIYNVYMNLIPDNDWAIFFDHDIWITTRKWFCACENAIEKYPEAGMFVCRAPQKNKNSRYKKLHGWQIYGNHTNDMRQIRELGKEVEINYKGEFEDVTTDSLRDNQEPATGFFMLIRKAVWREIYGEITKTFNKVDQQIHRLIEKHGYKVYLIKDLLIWHWGGK